MTLWQRLKEQMREGFEPTYIVKNPNKPAGTHVAHKRGVRWTRTSGARSKVKRLMAKASRRRNRPKKKKRRK